MAKVVSRCAYPDCPNQRAAKQRRGKNSPIIAIDSSRRWGFCRKHQKGCLKLERINWQRESSKK